MFKALMSLYKGNPETSNSLIKSDDLNQEMEIEKPNNSSKATSSGFQNFVSKIQLSSQNISKKTENSDRHERKEPPNFQKRNKSSNNQVKEEFPEYQQISEDSRIKAEPRRLNPNSKRDINPVLEENNNSRLMRNPNVKPFMKTQNQIPQIEVPNKIMDSQTVKNIKIPQEPNPKPKNISDLKQRLMQKKMMQLKSESQVQKLPESINREKHEIKVDLEETLNRNFPMCLESEAIKREETHQLDLFEIHPDSDFDNPKVVPEWAIKKYSRPDAGKVNDKPFSLEILTRILNYILDKIVDIDNQEKSLFKCRSQFPHNFWDIYTFIHDRFRAINKDLGLMRLKDSIQAIDLLEKMVRFFILSINEGREFKEFNEKMNFERLTDFLCTLISWYKSCRAEKNLGFRSKNESEFYCYFMVASFSEKVLVQSLLIELSSKEHLNIFDSNEFEWAKSALVSLEEENFTLFSNQISTGNYLQACILSSHYKEMRRKDLNKISKCFKESNGVSVEWLKNHLQFDSVKELATFISSFGEIETNEILNFSSISLKGCSFEYNSPLYINLKLGKSSKIDSKKEKKSFENPDNDNYFFNENVSRKFIINGTWKTQSNQTFDNNLSKIEEVEVDEEEIKFNKIRNESYSSKNLENSQKKQKKFNDIIKEKEVSDEEESSEETNKEDSFSVLSKTEEIVIHGEQDETLKSSEKEEIESMIKDISQGGQDSDDEEQDENEVVKYAILKIKFSRWLYYINLKKEKKRKMIYKSEKAYEFGINTLKFPNPPVLLSHNFHYNEFFQELARTIFHLNGDKSQNFFDISFIALSENKKEEDFVKLILDYLTSQKGIYIETQQIEEFKNSFNHSINSKLISDILENSENRKSNQIEISIGHYEKVPFSYQTYKFRFGKIGEKYFHFLLKFYFVDKGKPFFNLIELSKFQTDFLIVYMQDKTLGRNINLDIRIKDEIQGLISKYPSLIINGVSQNFNIPTASINKFGIADAIQSSIIANWKTTSKGQVSLFKISGIISDIRKILFRCPEFQSQSDSMLNYFLCKNFIRKCFEKISSSFKESLKERLQILILQSQFQYPVHQILQFECQILELLKEFSLTAFDKIFQIKFQKKLGYFIDYTLIERSYGKIIKGIKDINLQNQKMYKLLTLLNSKLSFNDQNGIQGDWSLFFRFILKIFERCYQHCNNYVLLPNNFTFELSLKEIEIESQNEILHLFKNIRKLEHFNSFEIGIETSLFSKRNLEIAKSKLIPLKRKSCELDDIFNEFPHIQSHSFGSRYQVLRTAFLM